MNRHLLRTIALGITAAAFGFAAPAAKASFLPLLTSPPVGGSASVFTYNLIFSTNANTEQLTAGNILTLYDFDAGVTDPSSVVVAPANFTVTVQTVGITPRPVVGTITPQDDPNVTNITFTYNGPTLTQDATFVATITTAGGPFTTVAGQYTSQNSFAASPNDANTQIGSVLLPQGLPRAVPEPTSVVLMGLGGVVALGLVARRRIANRIA